MSHDEWMVTETKHAYLPSYRKFLAVFGEEIPDVLQVQLHVGAGDEVRDVGRGAVLDVRPDVAEGARDDALVVGRALHGVRLAGAGLPVREHAAVEPVQDGRHQRSDLGNIKHFSIFSAAVIFSSV